MQSVKAFEPGTMAAEWARELIQLRRTIRPRRLNPPGPTEHELLRIVEAASAAPDHRELVPWRFVLVGEECRHLLADAFERALLERDPTANSDQREAAREKALRAPVLLLVVANLTADVEEVPVDEQLISVGCAIQNVLLTGTAMGYQSALTSGRAVRSDALRSLFALEENQRPVCFISIGTSSFVPPPRSRPRPKDYFSRLRHVESPRPQ